MTHTEKKLAFKEFEMLSASGRKTHVPMATKTPGYGLNIMGTVRTPSNALRVRTLSSAPKEGLQEKFDRMQKVVSKFPPSKKVRRISSRLVTSHFRSWLPLVAISTVV